MMLIITTHDTRSVTTIIRVLLVILEFSLISRTAAANDEVFGLWNAALCKPAFQKSTYNHYGRLCSASHGVDGDKRPELGPDRCFHTANGHPGNWWMVDLMSEYLVHEVALASRTGHANRAVPLQIDLFLSDPRDHQTFPLNTNGIHCCNATNLVEGTKSFRCLSSSYARYVKLLRLESGYLNMCEVEVMVSKKRPEPVGLKMLSKYFNIEKGSTMGIGVVVEIIVVDTVGACLLLCTRRGDLCSGFYWTGETRDCRLMTVQPYGTGSVVEIDRADLYVEPQKTCNGTGLWVYV